MKNQKNPKHKLMLTAVQNTTRRKAERDLQNKKVINNESSTKSVKAVTKEKDTKWTATKGALEINYQKAAADAINKVKQGLATKEI